MNNFRLQIPTTIVFGPGVFASLGVETAAVGRRALLATYADNGALAGLLQRIGELLNGAGVEVELFDRVESNPRHDTCDEGARLARESGCDLVLALGGGSVIDAAKAIAAATATGHSCWDFCRRPGGLVEVTAALPVVAVPTTAATGSEANCEAVITNWRAHEKCVLSSSLIFPRIAVCDPELHLTLPRDATADGCVDILSHCLEGYLSGEDDCSPQDRLTEGLINVVLEWGPVAVADGRNLRARRELQYAGLLAISDIAHAGRGGTWLMHNIEHALSGHYDIAHGRGMAVVVPRVMRFFEEFVPDRLARLGERCFDLACGGAKETAGRAVDALVRWLGLIGRNLTLGDVGIGDEKFETLAEDVIRNDGDGAFYHSVAPLDSGAIVEILRRCTEPN